MQSAVSNVLKNKQSALINDSALVRTVGFSKIQRLVSESDFNDVFGHAKKISSKYILILYIKTDRPYARLGVIVSKRIAKDANKRNRLKRIFRESFRLKQANIKNADIVVLARHNSETRSNVAIRQEIDSLWEKLIVQLQ